MGSSLKYRGPFFEVLCSKGAVLDWGPKRGPKLRELPKLEDPQPPETLKPWVSERIGGGGGGGL